MADGARRHRDGPVLRATLPHQLRNGDAAWLFLIILVVLLAALIIGDPGRIDRDRPWLHNLTSVLIGLITLANADAAVRLVMGIVDVSDFTQDAKVLSGQWRRHLAHQHHRLRAVVLEPRPRRAAPPAPRAPARARL